MNDALRTKLNLILVALLAFALGLGFTAKLDLTPPSYEFGPLEVTPVAQPGKTQFI